MNFKALEDELLGADLGAALGADLERIGKPKRLGRKGKGRELAAAPGLALLPAVEGPGRYACLGWDEAVTLKATRYLDPDGVVRYRAHLPGGGYVVVLEREATEDELAEAAAQAAAQAAKERAR